MVSNSSSRASRPTLAISSLASSRWCTVPASSSATYRANSTQPSSVASFSFLASSTASALQRSRSIQSRPGRW
jgi:hypothetical protein